MLKLVLLRTARCARLQSVERRDREGEQEKGWPRHEDSHTAQSRSWPEEGARVVCSGKPSGSWKWKWKLRLEVSARKVAASWEPSGPAGISFQ